MKFFWNNIAFEYYFAESRDFFGIGISMLQPYSFLLCLQRNKKIIGIDIDSIRSVVNIGTTQFS